MGKTQLPTDRQLRSGDRAVVLSFPCGNKTTHQSQQTATTLSVFVEKEAGREVLLLLPFLWFPWFLTQN